MPCGGINYRDSDRYSDCSHRAEMDEKSAVNEPPTILQTIVFVAAQFIYEGFKVAGQVIPFVDPFGIAAKSLRDLLAVLNRVLGY
ncbi:hypothetical protein AZH11_17275 [Pseudomonas simiae]|nr:hypothetical protein AZH11_17275 [Pseudomonas simiae]